MKISIITLTFNSEATIADTLKSVLRQNYENIEHIIIDNVSSDKTLEIVRSHYANSARDLKIISEKDKGISDGFNKGIIAATGDVIVFLNSDDIYLDDSLVDTVANAFTDNSVDYVHGDMFFEDEEHGSNRRKPLLKPLEYGMPINHPTLFLHKRVYDEVGHFDLSYRFAMDFHLICRMYQDSSTPKFKGIYLKEPCFVKMRSGGVSDVHELKSIDDVQRALEEFSMMTTAAHRELFLRRLRIRLKGILTKLNLSSLIKVWRRLKWR